MTVFQRASGEGFAVVDPYGQLLVDTVSPTRRAAIVNWLGAHAQVRVTADWGDKAICSYWAAYRKRGAGACEVVKVKIEAIAEAP